MRRRTVIREPHWWLRRGPSALVLIVVLALFGLTAFVLGRRTADILPEVGKDKAGEEPWTEPIGVESVRGFMVGHIPDCASGAVSKIVLWDENADPYWSVSGPATPMATFSVGATPEGFKVDTPLHKPPRGAVLRLVVFRRGQQPAGIRYSVADLVEDRVMGGDPLQRFTVSGWQTADVCGDGVDTSRGDTSTTVPG